MTTATHDFHPGNLVRARNREWVVQVSDNRQSDSDSLLPAELDAHCAPLYRLTRDELRYILDPADVMGADGRPDPAKLDLIARLGGDRYVRTRDIFEMERP